MGSLELDASAKRDTPLCVLFLCFRRHCKVCRKVEEKGTTTYNEVADELVQELAAEGEFGSGKEPHYDDKNIRRRVYDALNVLMAIDIISKDRKEIK